MKEVTDVIVAKTREGGSKNQARRLRQSGWVPAVAYGPGVNDNVLFAVDPNKVIPQRLKYTRNHLYTIEVEGGQTFRGFIKDITQDPMTRMPIHMDFFAVDMSKPIHTRVLVELHGKAPGEVAGGTVAQSLRRIEIECLPGDMKAHIDVDVSNLELGESIHVGDLKFAEGVKVLTHAEDVVVACVAPAVVEEATAEEGAEGEAAAGEAGGSGGAEAKK